MSQRAQPFHCPFCGDENLWPHETPEQDGAAQHGPAAWECRSCLRAFTVRMLGLVRPLAARSEEVPS